MKTSTVVVLVAVAAAAFFLYKRRAAAMPGSALNVGAVGGVAHSPDITTGGIASVLGSALPSLTSWFGGTSSSPASVPTDQYSPGAGLTTTLWNPVSASPSVLPYSYKQQNIDTAGILGTDDLFTPSSVTGGSSGSYTDPSGGDYSNVDYSFGT